MRLARRASVGAAVASVLALVAAAVAAIGPADKQRAAYVWPPSTLPGPRPAQGWYTPLPLLNRVPAALDVRVPCGLSPQLNAAGTATVLSTARKAETPALWIKLAGGELRIAAGARELTSVPWPGACPLAIHVAGGELRIRGRVVPLRLETLDDMPVVTGLFTTLDLGRGRPPEVAVQTRTYKTSFTTRQTIAAVLALTFAVAALVLAVGRRPRIRLPGPLISRAWNERDVSDSVVVATVLVWWIVAPVFTDDGWVAAEARAFKSFGDVNVLYDVWGLNSPVGRWLQWLTHWVVGSTNDLVVMRIPSLVALVVSWLLARWCLRAAVGGPVPRVARWALAGAFLVGAAAWEMTVRPEPFISLLVLCSLAATLSFVRSPRPAPLAVAVLPIVLGVTAHPGGVVAAAPVLAAAPAIVRWLRAGGRNAAAALGVVTVAAVSIGLVVFVASADLGSRVAAGRIFQDADRHRVPPWREYVRYELFDQYGGGSVGRRLSLALLILAALAWLLHSRRRPERVLAEPARAVAIGLGLLAFVSSKWPWHFGTLAAIGAVALASEAARLRLAPAASMRAVISCALLVGSAVYAWLAPDGWSPLDLQELEWSDVFNGWTLGTIAVLGALAVSVALTRSPASVGASLSAVPGWTLTVTCLVVVVLTVSLLVVDAAKSPWSPARQNLEALSGRSSCGLGNQLRGDPRIAHRLADGGPTLLAPAVAPYLPCATPPDIDGGVLEVPAFFAWQGGPWPITEPDGPYAAIPDLYRLEAVARWPHGVRVTAVDRTIPGFRWLEATRIESRVNGSAR